MISLVQPLHIGNAMRLLFAPPPGAKMWRILRKLTNDISGPNDATASVIYQGDEELFIDSTNLQNGVLYFYAPFWSADGGLTWTADTVVSGTPAANYTETTSDVLTFLRDRLAAGLQVEVERGNFSTEIGYIQVYTAPPSLERDLRFPLVTVHVERQGSGDRAIGELLSSDEFDAVGFDWTETEGWLSNESITIIGWTLNGDERNELRKAIRRVIMGNLQVFDAMGWVQIDLSAEDIDAVNGEYPSPIYQSMCTFSCIAPVRIGGEVGAISQVNSRSLNG